MPDNDKLRIKFDRQKVLEYVRDNGLITEEDFNDPTKHDDIIEDFFEAIVDLPDDAGYLKESSSNKGSKPEEFLVKTGIKYMVGKVAMDILNNIAATAIPPKNPYTGANRPRK